MHCNSRHRVHSILFQIVKTKWWQSFLHKKVSLYENIGVKITSTKISVFWWMTFLSNTMHYPALRYTHGHKHINVQQIPVIPEHFQLTRAVQLWQTFQKLTFGIQWHWPLVTGLFSMTCSTAKVCQLRLCFNSQWCLKRIPYLFLCIKLLCFR